MEQTGEIRQWIGDDEWINVTSVTGGLGQIQIRYGELFWLPGGGGVLLDTVISDHVDAKLFSSSSAGGWATRDQYKAAVREKRLRECPDNVQVIQTEQQSVPEHLAKLTRMGVRFF
jgi:hypothetical protein